MKRQKKVLLLHDDNDQGVLIKGELKKDGFDVIGPFPTTADAYVAVLKEEPDFAVIDADISSAKTNSLSNTLIQLKIEHLVLLNGSSQILKRRMKHGVLRGVITGRFINIVMGIRSELMTLQMDAPSMSGKHGKDDKLIV